MTKWRSLKQARVNVHQDSLKVARQCSVLNVKVVRNSNKREYTVAASVTLSWYPALNVKVMDIQTNASKRWVVFSDDSLKVASALNVKVMEIPTGVVASELWLRDDLEEVYAPLFRFLGNGFRLALCHVVWLVTQKFVILVTDPTSTRHGRCCSTAPKTLCHLSTHIRLPLRGFL